MNRERLQRAVDLAPTMKQEFFDISTWFTEYDCKTVACYAGNCALDPWFQSQGFFISKKTKDNYMCGDVSYKGNVGYIFFGYTAISYFFDIPVDDARYLFSPDAYSFYPVTPNDVAKRISEYLERYASGPCPERSEEDFPFLSPF